MSRVLSIFIVFSTLLTFTSCIAYHNGTMSDSGVLSSNNFKYIKTNIRGSSQATYILGIGGMQKYALVAEAKQNMLQNNALGDNQAIVNTTVNFKNSFFFGYIVVTTTCVVSADIVEFTASPNTALLNQLSNVNSNDFLNNPTVIEDVKPILLFDQSIAEQLSGDEKVIYLAKTKENITIQKYLNINEVQIGDIISFKDRFGHTQFGIVKNILVSQNKISFTYYNTSHVAGNMLMPIQYVMLVK